MPKTNNLYSFKMLRFHVFVLCISCFFSGHPAIGQSSKQTCLQEEDSLSRCYLQVIPEGQPKGILVIPCTRLPKDLDSKTFTIHRVAQARGILTLFVGLDKLELYFDDSALDYYDDVIHAVMTEHGIPKDKFVIGGLSSKGTGAMKYSIYCIQGNSEHGLMPAGAFAVDSPLDYARLWREAANAVDRNYDEVAYNEGKMIVSEFTKKLGGSPEQFPDRYKEVSVFAYGEPTGGNAQFLKELPFRCYIDPDINWYIKVRGKDYYDMNSLDAAAIVNLLKRMGNGNAELIVALGMGYNRAGERDPHSYSIMDPEETVDWILKCFAD